MWYEIKPKRYNCKQNISWLIYEPYYILYCKYYKNPRYLKINQIVCITKGNVGATILWWQQLQIIWVLVSVAVYYKCNEGSIIYSK